MFGQLRRQVTPLFLLLALLGFHDASAAKNCFDLPSDQIQSIRRAFDAFDTDKAGYISFDTLDTLLAMGLKMSQEQLNEVKSSIDEDGSGEIELEEFCNLAASMAADNEEKDYYNELKEAFRLYDTKGDGFISTKVVRDLIREMDPFLTSETLDEIVNEIDFDGSGTIDFEEFVEMMA